MKIERERSCHWLWSAIVAHSPRYRTSLESIGNNNNNNNSITKPEVVKYRGGVRWGIANCLMARWGTSVLAGSLSSDGVTIKIPVMIKPYTFNLCYEMLQINEANQGDANCLREV